MAGIAVPRQQTVQPQGRLQVARRWANNLRGAFLLRDRTVFDPVSGLMLSGTGAQGVHPFGTAYDISATSHYIDTGVTDLGGVTLHAEDGVPFSVTTKFRTTTTGTVIARAGASVTLRTFQLFSNGTSQSPVVVVRGTQTVYNWGYQDGEWHTVTVAWDGETVRVYGDTNREASFSRGTAAEETTQRILIGARSNGANFTLTGSSVEFAYVFDRALTRDEHLALVDNPYQVFRTERRIYAVEAVTAPPAINLDGSATGSAQANATLSVLLGINLAGSASASVTAQAELTTRLALQGSAIASALATGNLQSVVGLSLSGSAIASSIGTAALSTGIRLVGAAVSSAVAAGQISVGTLLFGDASGGSAGDGQVSITIPLSGESSGGSSATGQPSLGTPLTGAATGTVNADGVIAVAIPLAGVATSMSLATGTLQAQQSGGGSAVAQSSASGVISVGVPLTGAAQALSDANASLMLTTTLSGAAVAAALASAGLDVRMLLQGSAEAQSEATGTISSTSAGGGTAEASSSATGTLTVRLDLSGAALASAQAVGLISAGQQISLAGGATVTSVAEGLVDVQIPLAGGALASAVATGQSLVLGITLAGAAVTSSSAVGYFGEQPAAFVNPRWLVRRGKRFGIVRASREVISVAQLGRP